MADTNTAPRLSLGRAADYIFGRNALIGVASLMLLAISGYATWSGMNDFIVGASTSPASQSRDLPGGFGLSVSNEWLVIAIVVALTFLMWLALRETFGARRRTRDRFITGLLYGFLALWSIGFGYGFWWSLIAGEEATTNSMSALKEDARDASAIVSARLDAVRVQLDSVVSWSDGQMAREESSGGSCGVSSGAGRGPLYNARRSVRDSIASLRDSITKSWLGPVQADIAKLRATASSLEGATVAERKRSFDAMASSIRGSARNIAARSNALGTSTATEMRALAAAVSVEPGKPGFSCYDPTLAQRLTQAADQASEPARLKLRDAAFTEGPAGVANAVKNLWGNIASGIGRIPALVMSGGKSSGDGSGGEPITGRDLIALLATLGIDLGLFVLTVLNPPPAPPLRIDGSMKRQIEDAINTAIARAPGANMEWVRRHFIHDQEPNRRWYGARTYKGASYLIVPNLYSAEPGDEEKRALAMNQLAGVLDDLDLVYAISKREYEKLKNEETITSPSDLTKIRRERSTKRMSDVEEREKRLKDKLAKAPEPAEKERLEKALAGIETEKEELRGHINARPTRNHALLSKGERALDIAGWSDRAKADIEIFRLVDTEGLTPLLMVLNEAANGATGKTAPNDKSIGSTASNAPA